MYHVRTKHIDVRYHWIRKAIEEQLFQIRRIHTDENIADMMTKVITKEKSVRCFQGVNIHVYQRSVRSNIKYFIYCFQGEIFIFICLFIYEWKLQSSKFTKMIGSTELIYVTSLGKLENQILESIIQR